MQTTPLIFGMIEISQEENKKKQTIQPIINTDRNNNNACL